VIRRLLLITAALAVVAVAGCSVQNQAATNLSAGLQPGTSSHQLSTGDGQRTYLVHRPAGEPPAGGYPLVVMLHGGFGTAAQAERAYGWDELADKSGFVVVYPEGLDRAWNAGTCCGVSQRDDVDDVAFISSAVADVEHQVSIDPRRRFVTGMSNGAMMAYRMACQTSLFAAAAPVSGTQLVSCTQAHPLSVLHLHGADDPRVRLDGKTGNGAVKVAGPPIARVLEGWRQRDHCTLFTTSTQGALTSSTATCPQGRTVRWVVIAGLGHEWPGASGSATELDATTTIWSFFEHHPAIAA
jgi:polyhydroxybutyrate depolymerase